MGTRTIGISGEAYERLNRLKGSSDMCFSEVILKFAPQKKKLLEFMREIRPDYEFADAIEKASKEMR